MASIISPKPDRDNYLNVEREPQTQRYYRRMESKTQIPVKTEKRDLERNEIFSMKLDKDKNMPGI